MRRFLKVILACTIALTTTSVVARDLDEIRTEGVLRHLGIPYANFVTGSGDGLDVELMQGFARHLGLRYEYLASDWSRVFGDLTGHNFRRGEQGAERLGAAPIRGDVIASGMTVLDWRAQIVDFSRPTFPTSVWLIARADSSLMPITPSGSLERDIAAVKGSLDGHSVLALENTCLDPALYRMSETRARIRLPSQALQLNEMAPAILQNAAEMTLLDVPDALIALQKWPEQLKVIGPISAEQTMAAAFRKDSPRLREAFDLYLAQLRASGAYRALVEKYYPTVFLYYAEFFGES